LRAETWVVAGLESMARQKHKQSINLLTKAVKMAPHLPTTHKALGFTLCLLSRPSEALPHLYLALKMQPYDLDIYHDIVSCYLSLDQFKQALMAARSCLSLHPRSGRALCLIGSVLSTSEDGRAKAEQAFAKALNVEPGCTEAVLGLCDLLCHHNKHPQAMVLLQKSLGLAEIDSSKQEEKNLLAPSLPHSDIHIIFTKLGLLMLTSGRLQEGLDYLHQAIALCSTYTPALSAIETVGSAQDGGDVDPEQNESHEDLASA